LSVYEATIGCALVTGKHSDETTIFLCVLMAVVIIAALVIVAVLVFKKPWHLMLVQQDSIPNEVLRTKRIREALQIIVETPKPSTPAELLALMDRMEGTLCQ